ncbi:MAG: carbon-nitrogen hydrolase family protein [Vulcanimicrobiaceae bacterium]
MLIATAQTPVTHDAAENGASIRAVMRAARLAGADLVHFPEGAASGYPTFPEQDWDLLQGELEQIAVLARELRLWTVFGSNRPISGEHRPRNSVYVVSDLGEIAGRYDKRLCSYNEIQNHYSPGFAPLVFDARGLRFGCALCIEINFPEVFLEYERLGVDCLLFSSHSKDAMFGVLAQAHAAMNCYWVSVSVPAQFAESLPSGVIGPDGSWIDRCAAAPVATFALARLDTTDPTFAVPLEKARPWRRLAREGTIYRERTIVR